jgi:radical SAM-linked protein
MKLRIRFTKHGAVRYIGHLDMQRYFQRANRRAGLKVVYSEGFSPHQRMSFAMPLSVGYESDAEYFDIELSEAISSEDIMQRLNAQMTDGIDVTDCVRIPDDCENAMASVRAAKYSIRIKDGYDTGIDIRKAVEDLRSSASFIIKKPVKPGKKRSKIKKASYNTKTMEGGGTVIEDDPDHTVTEIRHLIYEVGIDQDGAMHLFMSAGSKDNVRPDLVLAALFEKEGLDFDMTPFRITRTELYTDGGREGDLIPLIKVGEHF